VTGKQIEPLTTPQIYKGAIAFIILQLIMVAVLIMYPGLVTGSLDEKVKVDLNTIELDAGSSSWGDQPALPDPAAPNDAAADPAAALMEEMRQDAKR
jgi:hypothetical protein